MFAKVFTGAVEASFHRRDARRERLRDFRVTAAFLHEREEGAILRTKLLQRVPQRVKFLAADRARRLGDVFVLF